MTGRLLSALRDLARDTPGLARFAARMDGLATRAIPPRALLAAAFWTGEGLPDTSTLEAAG